MDYKWYRIKKSSSSKMNIQTVNVTTSEFSYSFVVAESNLNNLIFCVKAYEIINGVKEEIRVSSSATVSGASIIISVSWETAFNGELELTYWKKS
jgi:hypothetical protein